MKSTLVEDTDLFIWPLQWRYSGRDSVSNHQPREWLLKRLIRHRSKKTSKLRVTGLCAGNSPETGEFPPQRASNAENVSIWWRHRAYFTAIMDKILFVSVIWSYMEYLCEKETFNCDFIFTQWWYWYDNFNARNIWDWFSYLFKFV